MVVDKPRRYEARALAAKQRVLIRKLREAFAVRDGDGEPTSYVTFHSREAGAHPAVTIAIAKRKGTNAIDIADRVAQKLDPDSGRVLEMIKLSPTGDPDPHGMCIHNGYMYYCDAGLTAPGPGSEPAQVCRFKL